jgi:hypothetical protein
MGGEWGTGPRRTNWPSGEDKRERDIMVETSKGQALEHAYFWFEKASARRADSGWDWDQCRIRGRAGLGIEIGNRSAFQDAGRKYICSDACARMHVKVEMWCREWGIGERQGVDPRSMVQIPEKRFPDGWFRSQTDGSDPRRMDSDPRRMVQIPDGWIQIPDGWIQIPPGFRSCSCHVTHREAVHVGSTEHPPLIRIDIPQSHLRE